jgi:hypothetical protein
MEYRQMYCSGCDRNVRVLITDSVPDDAQANVPDSELICAELGEWCNGSLCPLGAAEPHAMVRRLIHGGLPIDHLRRTRGVCDACGSERELVLYGASMAACTVCGTTRAWQSPRPPSLQ